MLDIYFTLLIFSAFSLFLYRCAIATPNIAKEYCEKPSEYLFHKYQISNIVDILNLSAPFAVLYLVFKFFFIDYIVIPSGSMMPNYAVNSYAFVNKTEFGIRSPLTGANITKGRLPKLGEPIITKFPLNPDILYIKRVIGFPGDIVSLSKQGLVVNNVTYPFNFVETKQIEIEGENAEFNVYKVEINEFDYFVIIDSEKEFKGISETKVGKDSIFLLGDNLTGSGDSRHYGTLPWHYVVGSIAF